MRNLENNSNDATIWLECALTNIGNSTQDERSPLYPLSQPKNKDKAKEIEKLTQDDFINFINELKKKIKANS